MLTGAWDVPVFSRLPSTKTNGGLFLRTARAHWSGGCAGVQPSALDKNKRRFVFEDGTCSLEREMCCAWEERMNVGVFLLICSHLKARR